VLWWTEFESRYRKELREKKAERQLLKEASNGRTVTLLFGARDEKHNQAVVLKKVLESR
jgi:uncharacterized protein YeaO (DUF488 family)